VLRSDRLVPPRRLDPGARTEFTATGEELARLLSELAALRDDERVLEVGCGAGALARALLKRQGPRGTYDGLDVDHEAIGWCRRRYRRQRGFTFRVADVADPRRNPAGAHRADEYRFPYADASFDVVVAHSGPTHLLPEACAQVLRESARVLAPRGRLMASFFLLNDTSRACMEQGRAGMTFIDAGEPVALLDEDHPDDAVAYDDAWVFETLRAAGLVLVGLHPGSWCGREEFTAFQDVIVAARDA